MSPRKQNAERRHKLLELLARRAAIRRELRALDHKLAALGVAARLRRPESA
jgi:hypothetical protein